MLLKNLHSLISLTSICFGGRVNELLHPSRVLLASPANLLDHDFCHSINIIPRGDRI
jgi:hypothetical protein